MAEGDRLVAWLDGVGAAFLASNYHQGKRYSVSDFLDIKPSDFKEFFYELDGHRQEGRVYMWCGPTGDRVHVEIDVCRPDLIPIWQRIVGQLNDRAITDDFLELREAMSPCFSRWDLFLRLGGENERMVELRFAGPLTHQGPEMLVIAFRQGRHWQDVEFEDNVSGVQM